MKMPKNKEAETLLKNHDSPRENEEPIRRKEGNSEEADENECRETRSEHIPKITK